ncbi:MAG: glycoside hydrolase family 31 protein [Candidatus Thorarchaeota archaeon]
MHHEGSLEVDTDVGRVRVSVLDPRIARIQISRDNYPVYESFSRIPYGVEFEISRSLHENRWFLRTSEFEIAVSLGKFDIELTDPTGRLILKTLPDNGFIWIDQGFECRMALSGEEHFYGLGEKTGPLDKRGRRYEMWNTDSPGYGLDSDPLYQSVPFLLVLNQSAAYGIFLDNTHRTFFDLGKSSADYYSFGSTGAPVDYYIIVGPRVSDVIDGYTRITGRPHFIPRWALGYQQSRFMEIKSEDDILSIASQLRSRGIPCDTIVLDIGYMDEFRIFTWNRQVFPVPSDFTSRLTQMGFRVMAILDPGVKLENGFGLYEEGESRGMFLKNSDGSTYVGLVWPGETVFPDFSRPEVREWFSLHFDFFPRSGLSCSAWIDMNEPSNCIYEGLREEYSMKNVVDVEGRPWEERLRNVYGLGMAEATFQGLKHFYPGKRPFILTRSGFAGYQRFAATWTGDNCSTWEHLALSIPMLLGLGLSGVSFCGADVGGFMGDCTPELLARWYQLGAFYPFFRNHTNMNTARQEPWVFGEEIEQISREAVCLRYQLLRYLYSLSREASTSGIPVMRPVFLHFQEDEQTHTLDDEFMVGPFLLVAPVLKEGVRHRDVYLPAGSWFDYWTDLMLSGPGRYTVDAPLSRIPIFVRGGAVLTVGDVVQTADESQGNLTLLIYPHGDGDHVLFEDDGISDGGPFATTRFQVHSGNGWLDLMVESRQGSYPIPDRQLSIEFRGINGDPVSLEYDDEERLHHLVRLSETRFRFTVKDDGHDHVLHFKWTRP